MKKLLYILCFGLLVVGCSEKKSQPKRHIANTQHPAPSTQHLAVMPTLDCLPYFIAEEKGWFKRDSLKVGLKMYTAQMDVDTALARGRVIGGFTDVKRMEVLERKYPKVKLDKLTATELHWTLVTNRMARLNDLSQFSDKMVAMTRFSGTDYLTDEAFKGVKLKSDYFKIQINDVKVRLKMVLCNLMDAAWLPEPQATRAEIDGHKRLLDEKKLNQKQRLGVLVINRKYRKNEKALLAIYNEAMDSIKKYGIQHYGKTIEKYCGVDTLTVQKLQKF